MTLLVAYSQSVEGAAALAHGRQIAARLQIPVVVFNLDSPTRAPDRHLDPPADVASPGERWFGPAHTAPALTDDLLDTAQELNVEMIVVGIRRRTPVGKLIMGSQAQRIVLGAAAPVLAVKATGADA